VRAGRVKEACDRVVLKGRATPGACGSTSQDDDTVTHDGSSASAPAPRMQHACHMASMSLPCIPISTPYVPCMVTLASSCTGRFGTPHRQPGLHMLRVDITR